MQEFSVTILGSNSALPANGRHPTAQLVSLNNHYYLIDCGEGTQMQLRRYGLKMQRIKAIFISHLHGDHYFGLPGLLNSLHLLGRSMPLVVYSPPGLKNIIQTITESANGRLQYPLEFVELDPEGSFPMAVHHDDELEVTCFPVVHRVPCFGYIFREKQKERTYIKKKGDDLGVRVQDIPRLKKGESIVNEAGETITADMVTVGAAPSRTYAFCTDTLPLASTSNYVQGVDTLYHEATFLESEAKRSKETHHSTAVQAAEVAAEANVGKLLLGHYSARYKSLDKHLDEARPVFRDTFLTIEGDKFDI